MARPNVFSEPTKLWHAAEGWREFPAGETDPGGAWHDKEGGSAPGGATVTQAMKDLIAAQDQIDAKDALLAAKDHDLAQSAKRAEEAEAKVKGLNQRALDAEAATQAADERARASAEARDAASARVTVLEADLAKAKAQIAKFDGDGNGETGGSRAKKDA